MASLYELTEHYRTLYDLLCQGEIDEDMFNDSLGGAAFEEEFETKCENYAKVIKSLEADAVAADAEAKRLAERKAAFGNNAKRMKERLYEAMKATGRDKLKTALFSFGMQANPERVVIDDFALLVADPQYWKIRKWDESELDKTAIREAIKAGAHVPGAHIEQGESLRIR